MDFLNKAFAQFSDVFRSMTPGARITSGLLLIVAVASVGYLFQHQVTGGDEYLFGGESIPTATLQKMEEAFGKAGLNGFSIDGGRVKVPLAQRAAYLAALADAKALPPNFGDKFKEAGEGGLFRSPKQIEQEQAQARQMEMSGVISRMKGIEQASVLIDTQVQPGLGLAPLKTASVAAQAVGGVPLDDDQVDKIRYYVAASIAGMKPENVTIADANGRVHSGDEANGNGPNGDQFQRATRMAEQDLNAKIRGALSYIPNAAIVSTVTLDHDKGSHSVEIKNDPKPIAVRTEEDTRESTHEATAAGGYGARPRCAGPGGRFNQSASIGGGGKAANETSQESKTKTVNALNTTTTEKETFGLKPMLAKVSVGIPVSYYEKVWLDRNKPKEGEEAKKPEQSALDAIREEITKDVRNHVATLLPAAAGVTDLTSLVTVTSFQDIKAPEIAGPAVTVRITNWLSLNWPMAALVGLVLFSLVMLRSLIRSVPAPTAESAAVAMRIAATEGNQEEAEEPVEATVARRLRRITGSGPSLRDELSEMVKEDPDSAANILRGWIGNVN